MITILINLYYWWGMAYLATNKLEAAHNTLNKGLKYLNSKKDIDFDHFGEKFMIYCALSQVHVHKQDFCKYEEYLRKAIKLLADDSCLSIRPNNDIYDSLKSALMEIEKNNPPRTSNLLKSKTVEDLAEWYYADVCFNIANGYYYLRKDKLAEKYYKKSLALLLNKKEHTQKTIAYVYYRIGQIALEQKKKQKAQDSFKKGLKFALTAY